MAALLRRRGAGFGGRDGLVIGGLRDRLRGLGVRLGELLGRKQADRELDEEIRFHVEMETEEGLRKGLPPTEARRRALIRFGGVDRFTERTREVRGLALADGLSRHVRLAVRRLRKEPLFTLTTVVTLGVGLGGLAIAWAVVDAVLMAPSPFPEPDRLVMVWETHAPSGTRHEPASWPDIEDFRTGSRTLSAIAAVTATDVTVSGDGDPERVGGVAVTPNLTDVLGVQPLVGRAFTGDDGPYGPPFTILLGESYWRTRYGGDPGIVGRTLTVNGGPATVVGVLPASAELGLRQVHDRADYATELTGRRVDVWIAMRPSAEAFPRSTHPFLTLARLADGATLAEAGEELGTLAAELEAAYPENADRGVNLEAYHEVVFGPVRPALLLLLGAAGLVLLVACANVLNLLLARTTTRAREMAVRKALGARGRDLAGQLGVEGMILGVLGGSVGLGLGAAGLPALIALAPGGIPRLDRADLAGAVLPVVAAALVTGLVLGLLPWLQLRRSGDATPGGESVLQSVAGAGSGLRGRGTGDGRRLRSGLVVAEIALAVTLVAGAGLLVRSFLALRSVDPGFQAAGVATAEYGLPATRYPMDFSRWPDLPEIHDFHGQLVRSVRDVPGVASAALTAQHPLDPGFTNSFVIVGREAESADLPEIRMRMISPDYLETLRIPLLQGRDLGPGDDVGAAGVALINDAAAERFFPEDDPVGDELRFWGRNWRIVGVLGNERFRGVDQPAEAAVYIPLAQAPQPQATVVLRGEPGVVDPLALMPPVRSALSGMDDEVALHRVERLEETVAGSIAEPRFTAFLLGLLAGVATLLALVGVHGLLAYTVARRAPEMGIRMALGASRGAVVGSVLKEGLVLAFLGVALGVGGVLAAGGVLETLVFDVTPRDPGTLLGVAAAVLAVAGLASLSPALRATRLDPARVLRSE